MWSLIQKIWQGIRAVQSFTMTVLFLLVVILIVASLTKGNTPVLPDAGVLVLNLKGVLVEQTREEAPEIALLQRDSAQPREILMRHLIEALKRGAVDSRIKGAILSLHDFRGGAPSKLHRLGVALDAFRKNGKKVIATSDSYGQAAYLLAAHSDKILLHPMGSVMLTGYGRFRLYYKALLDKLNITAHVFRVGTFKSAIEPYIRDDMSPAARRANEAFLGDMWEAWVDDVTAARKLSPGAITAYIDNAATVLRAARGDTAQAALNAGLVDAVMSRVEQRAYLKDAFVDNSKDGGPAAKPTNIAYGTYLQATGKGEATSGNAIAIVVARGSIVDGKAPRGVIGGDTFATLIRQARQDKSVKALVLRVDSGGGSAFASEVIRRELAAAQTQGKPVVASMASVAASGGYWISASADEIWAAPTTITGSIGIFGFVPTFEKSLDSVGIHNDGLGTTPLSGAADLTRGIQPVMADLIQQGIENGYRRFITLVGTARHKTPAEVDAIAQGRVWSGQKALDLGLVDHLGTLDDAIKAAAERAGISDWRTVYVEKQASYINRILSRMLRRIGPGTDSGLATMARLLAPVGRVLDDAKILVGMNDPQGMYAMCLACRAFSEEATGGR